MPFQRTPASMVGAVLWLAIALAPFVSLLAHFHIALVLVCFVYPLVCVYCFMDARERRMKNYRLWTVLVTIPLFTLLAFALYQGNKCLKVGQTRSGGRGWDSCKWYAIIVTIFFTTVDISFLKEPFFTIVIALPNVIVSLLIGLIIKKNVKEIGPTCPLETLEKQEETLEKQDSSQA